MSRRVVGYDGRSPRVVDEGPASASASDPMAMYGRLSVGQIRETAGFIGDVVPIGGAGPIERRAATPEELAAARAREVKASPIAPLPRTPIPLPAQEEPAMPAADPDPVGPRPSALQALSEAVSAAADAWTTLEQAEDRVVGARLAWTAARHDLDEAYRALEQGPPLTVTPADPAPIRATAEGGRATAEQLQQSRRNGQAQMQAQRRASELTSAAAAKADAKAPPSQPAGAMPAYQRRILDELIRTNGDRTAAAATLGYKPTSLVGSLGPIRKRTDLTELERAVLSSKRA